ncbi:hypothetical protein FAZ69_15825 [Trinickia terrae]|uniref:Uncharacterized protein n=1 Tax=Trinickia terrae TaxID=2571161 RepID=A0A4V5PIL0_9BURK|nr:hypothetical protein [Trinickia terrae]TKC87750.1 hypothetical protein FAZ69_15825 [Trinickia terrae]
MKAVAAAETSLMMADHERANRYARQLSACTQAQSCRWVTHHVQWIVRSSDWLLTRDAARWSALQIASREAQQLGIVATMPKLTGMLAA